MDLTPELASLVGAFIGASAAIVPALLTNRATRSLERDHRLWERRIDAIEETYRAYTMLASARRSAVAKKEHLSIDQDSAWPLRDEAKAAGVKLELYGALDTKLAFELAFNAWAKWYMALTAWHVHERAEARWSKVQELSEKADAADEALFQALRHEASLRPQRRFRLRFRRKHPNRELPR